AVRLRRRVGRLAADLGDVVVEAHVPDGVVLREQHALGDERVFQVPRRRLRSPRLVVVLVLEVDHEHVPDRGGAGRRRRRGRRRGRRGGGGRGGPLPARR